MTSGRLNTPKEITCERCGKTAQWKGGRRRRYCSPTCAHGARTGSKPRPPKEPGTLSQIHTRRSRQLKIERGQCADCGLIITEHNVVCIDWDHRNPTEKTFTIAHVAGRIRWEKIETEIAKCDAVCRNCHALRTHHGNHWANPKNPDNQNNRGKQWRTAKPPRNTEPHAPNS